MDRTIDPQRVVGADSGVAGSLTVFLTRHETRFSDQSRNCNTINARPIRLDMIRKGHLLWATVDGVAPKRLLFNDKTRVKPGIAPHCGHGANA